MFDRRPRPLSAPVETVPAADDRIDPIAVALGVVEPFQDQGDGTIAAAGQDRLARRSSHRLPCRTIDLESLPRQDRADVAREVDRPDDRRIQLASARASRRRSPGPGCPTSHRTRP